MPSAGRSTGSRASGCPARGPPSFPSRRASRGARRCPRGDRRDPSVAGGRGRRSRNSSRSTIARWMHSGGRSMPQLAEFRLGRWRPTARSPGDRPARRRSRRRRGSRPQPDADHRPVPPGRGGNGKLTGFSAPGGLATKRRMLELEGAPGSVSRPSSADPRTGTFDGRRECGTSPCPSLRPSAVRSINRSGGRRVASCREWTPRSGARCRRQTRR